MFGNFMNYISLENEDNQAFSKLSTKERILRAAFELSSCASAKAVSLSDIAKKAGIAKPGIFRYYKSKDDLQETMKNRFFDDFCNYIHTLTLQKEKQNLEIHTFFKERETKLLEWFIHHNDYLLFFLNTLVESDDFIPVFVTEMKKRSLGLAKETAFLEKKAISHKLYLRTTEIFFLLARVYALAEGIAEKGNENLFCKGLVSLLYNGWSNLEEISDERIKELDAFCNLDEDFFPEENRMFQALSSLLEEYTLSEITVEKMSSELGMAKSSLYSHYKNKEDMIKTLIEEELLLMLNTMNKTVEKGNNFSEHIYLHMRSQIEYLSKRTGLMPVCNRLSVQGFLPEKFLEDFFYKLNEEKRKLLEANYPFVDIGFPIDGTIIGGWFFSLSVSAFKLGQVFQFSQDEIINIIRQYYSFMKEGLKNRLTDYDR